ncbi:helix-turn-helix DNA-binding protein [Gordonia phage Herod]|uniref:Helix-turn-helix DNA binding domain protein n=5 Tax=Nymphadoravirus TaxID=2169636 RepID=A0A142KAS1_9CAUD|nr:CRO protein [Gordonia phage Nymphadora]YP_010652910.1 helix-turn-helix DNA-binding protein [Gordonia phage Herod]AOE43873.1 hypothetical protein SEA_BATSTARR_45 [Gordonia phage BatStarr]QDP43326.1 hypothetical protein SEA_EVIARTO_45 [Gordonia phage Eviarto]QDP43407.1 hypothetical protein SEA_TIMTAM_45 [Gordonia phage TimTam]AMS03204.1 helix-turn-helix DNA binding domain protein [Gordonia phage Nymphadora]QOP67346.1 helix-turn-helix DNA-binding protein [Gordonia phage Herod]
MGFTSRSMYAEVDLDMFMRALRRSGMSYQELADEATRELRKIARSERRKRRPDNVPAGVSKALIGQIVNGAAKSTHELRGLAIERALEVSDGDLFVPRVVRGSGTTNRRVAS